MADGSKIEWLRGLDGRPGATWNPIVGCSVVSPGCTNCYAMRLAGTRLRHHPSRVGLTQESKAGPVWNGEVRLYEPALDQPLRWRRPRRIFVCAHGDLFAEQVPDKWIDRVFATMALAPQHAFLVLTKRPARMRAYMDASEREALWMDAAAEEIASRAVTGAVEILTRREPRLPLPNVWAGVSVEDQVRADERIPELVATPAAIRFISAEPLLGPIDLFNACGGTLNALEGRGYNLAHHAAYDVPRLDWVICGGESGPGARPMHPDWVRSLRDQCAAAGVPFFFKQWGEWLPTAQDDGQISYGRDKRHGWNIDRPDETWTYRVGKRAAGRMLDGREHNEVPA